MFYTDFEERFHAITHGAGAVLALFGAAYLLSRAVADGDVWRVVSFAVYGITLVLLYTASTLYHAVKRRKLKARLRVLDHAAIYLLIAGSYTPLLLIGLWGPLGWALLATVWLIALAGVIYKLTLLDRFPRFSTVSYLAMGWLALLAVEPMLQQLAPVVLGWLLAGGLFYTVGSLIHHYNPIRFAHVVWHGFVLAGSTCHFVAIARL